MGTVTGEIMADRRYINTFAGDGTNRVSATRSFRVISDNQSEGARSILASAGLPDPWDVHPEDNTIFAKVGEARQAGKDSKVWIVTVSYDDEITRFTVDAQPPNRDPTQEPITVEYYFERYQKLANGGGSYNKLSQEYQVGFTNSAGEAFDPQPTIDASRSTFRFTENKPATGAGGAASFDWNFLVLFKDAVNSVDMWGGAAAANTIKVLDISAGPLQTVKISENPDNTVQYRTVTYVLQEDRDVWDLKQLDQGNFSLTDPTAIVNAKQEPSGVWSFFDPDGNPVVRRLDGAGNVQMLSEEPKFIVLEPSYVLKDLNDLKLPNPFTSPPTPAP